MLWFTRLFSAIRVFTRPAALDLWNISFKSGRYPADSSTARTLIRPAKPFDNLLSSTQPFEWGRIWQPPGTPWHSEGTFRHISA